MRVEVEMQNRSDAAIHVFTDLVRVRSADGTHGSVREFRDRYRMRQATAGSDDERARIEAIFSSLGIFSDQVRQLVQPQIEIPPGQSLTQVLPHLLSGTVTATRFELDLAYHDDATDRYNKLSKSFDIK